MNHFEKQQCTKPKQKEIVDLIFTEFSAPTNTDGILSPQQIEIVQKLKLSDDVPKYLRHIKDEAREIGIKGTRKLTEYLNIKQTLVIVKNSLNSDTVDELVSAAG